MTAKNSQHAVAEDAARRLQAQGAKVKSLTLHAKTKMCLKEEVLCNPEHCQYAKDHYTKVASNNLIKQLEKKKNLGAKTFKKFGTKFEVCPFELQMEVAPKADLLICDYNYVFSPRNMLGRLTYNGLGKTTPPNLIVDEAHNLPSRANEYFSSTLSAAELEADSRRATHLPEHLRELLDGLVIAAHLRIPPCRSSGRAPRRQS